MAPFDIRTQLQQEIERLNPEAQYQLLELARTLAQSPSKKGMTWERMKKYSSTLSDGDAAEILAAIEADCEKVDAYGW